MKESAKDFLASNTSASTAIGNIYSSFDGESIAFIDGGRGAPVVLLHGYATDAQQFWYQTGMIERLQAAGRRVIAPDLRGHGCSARPPSLERYEDQALARDVVSLVDYLQLQSYDLVGYSFGAIVAGVVAQLDPRVASLVLGGIGDTVMDPDWARPRLLARALLGDADAAARDPLVQDIVNQLSSRGGDHFALGAVQHGHTPLPSADLAHITARCLVICGADDDLNGDPDVLAAAIPRAAVRRVPGGHAAFATAAFQDVVMHFLGGSAGP